MSSSTERKSPQDLITEAQQKITTAEKVHPCVAVTEPNWMAMISTQRSQIDLLKEIRDTLPTLTTEKELKVYMDRQLKVLMQYTEQTKEATAQFQTAMETSAAELTENINRLITDTEKQVGRMSESCSNNISMLRSTSGGQTGETYQQTVLACSDTFGGTHSVGTDAAYLIGDIGNIIDEDAPVEDCTTKYYPAERKKNKAP